jgi:hypothetical protein
MTDEYINIQKLREKTRKSFDIQNSELKIGSDEYDKIFERMFKLVLCASRNYHDTISTKVTIGELKENEDLTVCMDCKQTFLFRDGKKVNINDR